MAATVWRNWAGTEQARPARTARPRTVEELRETVRRAVHDGLRVRAVGSGHSFTGAAVTDGVLIRMDGLAAPVEVAPDRGLVTVEAGMPLHQLNAVLAAHGAALTNLGDIDHQTVSGALATGTHGTGRDSAGLAAQVAAVELVTADGGLVRCSATERPDLFAAARVSLGALGVVSRVTLRCEPAFTLEAVEAPMPLARVLAELDHLVAENEHLEFYWFPHTDRALTKRNNRLPAGTPARPPGRLRAWFTDEFVANTLFERVNRLATAWPAAVPRLNALSSRALSTRRYSDASYRVFTSPRRVVFREAEYALPRAAVVDVLREVRAWLDRSRERVPFPCEVRFAPAEDSWLSPAHGRETAYLAVHQYHRLPHARYFEAVAAIAGAAGGRPHWGKLHGFDAAALRPRYPRFDAFRALRATMDPAGSYTNPYLDRVLGPVDG